MAIGKMNKHKELLKHHGLFRYLPETHWLSPEKAKQMLKSYSTIFIKPNHGTGGSGIIRVKKKKNGYEVRYDKKRKYVSSHSVYKLIHSYKKPSERYLVQRGLQLAKYNGMIFDIRVYLQKPDTKWTISGMVARVAAPNQYVTNYHKGGHGESLYNVLSKLFKDNEGKVINRLKRMKKLSIIIAQILDKQYSHIHELGVDFGMEKNGRLWIIEANSRPGHNLFTHLSDKKMLYKIKKNRNLIKKLYS